MTSVPRRARENVAVLEDQRRKRPRDSTEDDTDEMDESKDPLEESGCTVSEEEEVDDAVLEDMEKFEESFRNISQRYRLINRIGEGTFSTVYKAEDLLYELYNNDWDIDANKENEGETTGENAAVRKREAAIAAGSRNNENETLQSHAATHRRQAPRTRKPKYVAIKKIYVTSSPNRILNELELLHDLRDSPNVCPLITAFRHHDQVIAILPFFQHRDFREYYREMTIHDMRFYFHSLFTALKAVHDCEIIHRDIKPTNFLYSPLERRGVLVDFGLAEREGTDYHQCNCVLKQSDRERKFASSVYNTSLDSALAAGQPAPRHTYPTNDSRSSRRANRAGTRGFRAPEVLLKCTAQTVIIDVWSCGVILLTFLTKRFPFFHSADDIDAFIELCCIFGRRRMKVNAELHGQVMHTNIPSISENGHGWEKIILWCMGRPKSTPKEELRDEELEAINFMRCCLQLDPAQRITAEKALTHPWLAGVGADNGHEYDDDDVMED